MKPVKQTALILLYDDNYKVLIQHRTDDAPISPGFWGFFGGSIEDGETPKQAVIRECFEELNYRLKNPLFVLKNRIVKAAYTGVRHYFIEQYDGSKLTLNEGQAMRWVSESDLGTLKMRPYNRDVLKEIIGIIKSL